MTKPFNPLEIVARVRCNLRRYQQFEQPKQEQNPSIVRLGELALNTNSCKLLKNNQEIALTPMEYKILTLLMQSPGKIFTKQKIYEHISGVFF